MGAALSFLAQPIARTVAIRTAKNILVLGATATAAYFTNNVFRLQAQNALQSATSYFKMIRSMARGLKGFLVGRF
jgi:hypothetical protein